MAARPHERAFAVDASGSEGPSGVAKARDLDAQKSWTGLAEGEGQPFPKDAPDLGRDPSP